MHTGDVIVELLKALDVRHIFGVPGEQTLPLYDAVARREAIQHIVMRDERNLPYAALAYSRLSGKIGVLDATVGPGAALLTLGLLEALHSTTPLLAIISDLQTDVHPMTYMGAASQGTDQPLLLRPAVKWVGKALARDHVPILVRQAMLHAASGRPGPSAVIVPRDVFFADWPDPAQAHELARGVQPHHGRYPRQRSIPHPDAVEAALRLLNESSRPLIVAGGGVLHSQATAALLTFAERFGIPVATTLTGKGAIAETHPLALGVLGGMGTTAAEQAARAADLLFFIGFRSAQNSTLFWTLPLPGQRVVHLDIDPEQPGRFATCDVELVGDARATLEVLLERSQQQERATGREAWNQQVAEYKRAWEKELAAETRSDARPLAPQRVVAEIGRVSTPGDVLVGDASFSSGWAAVYYQLKEAGRQVLLPRGMAGLGFGLPAAIGAKVAAPERQVFLLAGDGGFAYSLSELLTLKTYGIKVIAVILNNRSWGWMEWVAKLNFDQEYFALPDVPFARIAQAAGLRGVRVQDAGSLADALSEAVRADESTVIDVESAVWEAPIRSYREALRNRQAVTKTGVVSST
ncbi:MAG: thiamine pyrophosphate-binding protein [Firmicutes bacterium]|nr:thiamine pyrophosphate-binding protein [Bacillota bacterium]